MKEQKMRIEGRVAAILNARELVINVGGESGVIKGMKFAVLAESPTIVTDPITDEKLDQIDREKVRVEAVEVRQKITVCRTFRVKRTPPGPLYVGGTLTSLVDLAAPPREIPETLRMEDASVPQSLPEEESYVRVKDRVIEVEE